MTIYNIRQSSPWLYFLTFMTVIFSGMAILLFLSANDIIPKGQPLVFILCFAPVMGLAFYLPRFTATAETELIIDNHGVKRNWLRQFLLHNRPDEEFKWSEIEDYVFQPDRQFEQFKLHLKDKTNFKFYHNNDHESKDDFTKFRSDFIQKVNQINIADNDKRNDIKLGKTIYETTLGLIFAVICVIMIVGLPIMLLVLPHGEMHKTTNYAMLAASYMGGIYFIAQVYKHRKIRKEYDDSFK